jgi:hypothetical protein
LSWCSTLIVQNEKGSKGSYFHIRNESLLWGEAFGSMDLEKASGFTGRTTTVAELPA